MRFVPFTLAHLAEFEPNRFCKLDQIENTFTNPECEKYTMLTEAGKPLAMVFFKQTEEGVYAGYFLISVDFSAKDCVPLRDFVQQLIEQRGGVKKVWTASRQAPELANWHKFLGLHLDGTMQINGATYDVWSMTWE